MGLGVAVGHFVLANPEAFFAPMTVGTTDQAGVWMTGSQSMTVEETKCARSGFRDDIANCAICWESGRQFLTSS
jgi:hypothetical protein